MRTSRDRAPEHCNVLRARHAETASKYEKGHARHADRLGLSDFPLHGVDVRPVFEQASDQIRIEAAFGGDVEQRRAIADIAALDKIGVKQPVDHRALGAAGSRPPDQAMRVERVRRTGDPVEGEGQVDLGAELNQTVVHHLQLAVVSELPRHVRLAVESALRNGRVELVGAPADDDRLGLVRERRGEALCAEIAPGANDVAHDIDGQRLVGVAHRRASSFCSGVAADPTVARVSLRRKPAAPAPGWNWPGRLGLRVGPVFATAQAISTC